jgi:hypothetical protein
MASATGAAPEETSVKTQRSSPALSGGAPPPKTPVLAMELAADSRFKSALHRLVLVLPLTLLIFEQALRHPTVEIELPIIKLKILMQTVMPIFFLILSYMIFRGMRYSRLVLLNIFDIPTRTNQLIEIVVDNADAYKINSAYCDETLDPTAADLIEEFQEGSHLVRTFSKISIWFNIFRGLSH